MKERPIIFSAPMVTAILAGRKSMTRRVIGKEQPWPEGLTPFPHGLSTPEARRDAAAWCPYGQPGDRLWVREAWAWLEWCHQGSYAFTPPEEPTYPPHYVAADGGRRAVVYRAGTEKDAWGMKGEPKWRSPIHMPRTASRITLEVTDVRVERVQEISEKDVIAEGCPPDAWYRVPGGPLKWFLSLWNRLHAKDGHGWEANPWVWVLAFRRLEEEATTGEARA